MKIYIPLFVFFVIYIQGCGEYANRKRDVYPMNAAMKFDITKFSVSNGQLILSFNNAQSSQLRIFEATNSWGAYAYRIKITAHETVFDLKKKKDLVWTRNVPGYIELNPGENVLAFSFLDGTWSSSQEIGKLTQEQITCIDLIYDTEPSPESTELKVFCGPLELKWADCNPG